MTLGGYATVNLCTKEQINLNNEKKRDRQSKCSSCF